MWCGHKHGNKHINIDQTESTLFCWGRGNPEPDKVWRHTSEDFLEMTSSSILTADLRQVLGSKRSKNPPNRWKFLAVFPEKWEYLPGAALAACLTCQLQMRPCWDNLCSWHPGIPAARRWNPPNAPCLLSPRNELSSFRWVFLTLQGLCFPPLLSLQVEPAEGLRGCQKWV